MDITQRISQIERMIEKFYSLDNVEKASLYIGNTGRWTYYYSFSGWLKGKYFQVYIRKLEDEIIEISHTTDCKRQIKTLINKLLKECQ